MPRILVVEDEPAIAEYSAAEAAGLEGELSFPSSLYGIDATGALLCWGDNSSGQLGLADRERRQLPEPVLP